MSEFLREYIHVVADPEKHWPYFDILGCLKMLPWSVTQCYAHIWPQWLEGSSFTHHAVVQLALYACDPFHDVPADGYPRRSEPEVNLIDQDGERRQDKYLCRSVITLIEALATAFIGYDYSREYSYGWQAFQAERDIGIQVLKKFLWCWEARTRRRITPEHPALQHNKDLPKKIHEVIEGLQSFTEHDYEGAGWPTNNPRHPVIRACNWWLLQEMDKAFRDHGPLKWPQVATYRALAAILNQMKIDNADGKQWKPSAIKMMLRRGPSSEVVWTTSLAGPNLHRWHMKLK